MSLVGTRPILQDELLKYELHHRARIAIKPGITGMWQVSGRSDITDFEEVVRLDTEYISNWNFGLDDCWHADQLVVGLADDDKGYTNLIVQSKKGEQVLEKIKQDFDIYPVDTERAIALDGIMVRNAAHPHPKREEYYQDMGSHFYVCVPII